MESNINFNAIEAYSKTFTDKVCDAYFEKKEHISGEEILELTPIKQINLFAIYELFKRWKQETEDMKSPYFDYEHKAVREALHKYMNVLSKHISVDDNNFKRLFNSAVQKTLLLIFSPYEYFKIEINDPDKPRLKFKELKELKKYVKINQHLLNAYIERFEREGIEEIFNDTAVRLFDEVCEKIKETPEDFEKFQKQFDDILPLDINQFYDAPAPSPPPAEPVTGEDPSKSKKEKASHKTLNDVLQKDQKTFADDKQFRKIEGIKKNITINQRFMFVNELFRGDVEEFETAVGHLDNCDDYEEAMKYVQQNLLGAKGWDEEREEVREFIDIVDKRFS